jgi:hypothetical protein
MLQRDVGPDLKTAGGASRRDAATGKAVPMIDERIAVSAPDIRATNAGPDFESMIGATAASMKSRTRLTAVRSF